jgi:hypothetical protein
MQNTRISVNPLAEYLLATERRRNQILKDQLNPDPLRIPRYQLAKARIRKSISLNGDLKPINDGIRVLKNKKPEKQWQKNDVVNSIIVLEKFKKMTIHSLITDNEIEVIKPEQKHLNFKGLSIIISPDVIFRITIDGKKCIGACKIHISKTKPFNHVQSKLIANLLEQYLSNCVAGEDDFVDPALCFCIDPFSGTNINSNSRVSIDMKQVTQLCEEIKQNLQNLIDQQRAA